MTVLVTKIALGMDEWMSMEERRKDGNVMLQHIHVMLYLFSYHNQLIPFHSKTALSWWFNFATNNKTCLGLHVKSQILLTFGLSKQIFIESPILFFMEIHPLAFTLIHVDGQTNGYVKANRAYFQLCEYTYKLVPMPLCPPLAHMDWPGTEHGHPQWEANN
jgi:hypothetical protein